MLSLKTSLFRAGIITALIFGTNAVRASELKFKLVNQSESIFLDRFPKKASLLQPIVTPRNAKFGIIAAVSSNKAEAVSIKVGKIRLKNNSSFAGTVKLHNLIPVHIEGNTQGPLKNYPGGKVHDYWVPYFVRLAPFDVLEAVDSSEHDTIKLTPEKVAGVLLEFTVPKNAMPGLYSAQVTLLAGKQKKSLPFSFRVYSTVMPDNYTINSFHWLWPEPENLMQGKSVKWWSEAHWKLLENSGKVLHESGDNTIYTPLIFGSNPLIRTERGVDGKYHFDLTGFERWINTFSKLGFRYFAGHHLHSWMWPLYVFDEKTGTKKKIELGTKERERIYIAFLPQLYKSLRKLDKVKVYHQQILDEPKLKQLTLFRTYSKLCRKYLPGVCTIDALVHSQRAFLPYMDEVVFHITQALGIKRLKSENPQKNFWIYSSTAPYPPFPNRHLDRPLIENRLWPLLCIKFGACGYLNWAANIYRGIPSEYATSIGPFPNGSQNPGHPPGDAWFFYRGPNGLRTSLRMLNYRDGLVDATLLTMLKRKKTKIPQLLDLVIFQTWEKAYKIPVGSQKLAKYIGRGYSVEPQKYNSLREQTLQELQK